MKKRQDGRGCIYSVINLRSNKEYIGKDKTGDPEHNRWKHHIKMAEQDHPKGYFQRAIKAAGGPTKFKWAVIWRGPVEKLNEKEIYYIKKRHTFVDDPACRGYNLTKGGDGTPVWAARTKKKISLALKHVYENPEARKRQSAAILHSYAFNPSLCAERSAAALRQWSDISARKRASRMQRHRWADPSEREKASKAHNLQWNVVGARDRQSASQLRSYKENPERRAKQSATQTRIALNPKERLRRRILQLHRYEDPAEREKTSVAGKLGWIKRRSNNPDEHDKMSTAAKCGWETHRANALKVAKEGKMKKRRIKPDLKTCVHDMLHYAIQQLEELNAINLYGVRDTDASPLEAEVYEDARALAIAYIKKGVEL